MNVAAILGCARSLGVTLRLEGDTIKAKGPSLAIEQILPALRQHKPELLKALTDARPDTRESSEHWLVLETGNGIERWFKPAASRGDLMQRYPGAILVALPSGAEATECPQELTAEDMTELGRLVQLVASAYQSPAEEIQEMREVAAQHPGSALISFRAMAKELGLPAQESLGHSGAGGGQTRSQGQRSRGQ